MEARQLVMVTSFTKNRRKSLIANEAVGTDTESLGGAYELHPAIHLEDSEREGEYVSRHTLQTRESVRYHLDS